MDYNHNMKNLDLVKVRQVNVREYETKSKTSTSDFVIDPYVGCTYQCKYCCAEYMKKFTHHIEEWGDFIDVKSCDKKISHIRLTGKRVLLSSVTDPYNHFEKEYQITRSILKQLEPIDIKLSILTKSDLVLRDLDILKNFKNLDISFSLFTGDDNTRKIFEPHAPSIEERLNTLKTIHENGIKTSVSVSPIFPEITDFKEIIEKSKDFVDEYRFENLNLRSEFRARVLSMIEDNYPHLTPLYEDLYKHKNSSYWIMKEEEIEKYCKENQIPFKNCFYHEKIRKIN